MGRGTLTMTERIEGTEYHTLKFKMGRNRKGALRISNTLAVPVEYNMEREELIKERKGNSSIELNFVQHYIDNKKTIERLDELKNKYTKEIEPIFYDRYKDGKYTEENQHIEDNIEPIFVR